MRILAWTLWAVAIVWMVLVFFGGLEFQELYGGTSGIQAIALGVVIGLVPAGLGWWAYRHSR